MERKIEKLLVLFIGFLLSVYLYLHFIESKLLLSLPLYYRKSSNTTLEDGDMQNVSILKKGNFSQNGYYDTLNLDYFQAKDFLKEPPPDSEIKSPKELVKVRIIRAERLYLQNIAERNWYIMSHPKQRNKYPVDEIGNVFKPAFKCPHELQQVGVSDNSSPGTQGNWVCGFKLYQTEPKPKECVVYTFGLPFRADFEKEWTTKTDCKVFKFHVRKENVTTNVTNTANLEMQPYKYIAGKDNTLRRIMDTNDHGWLELLVLDIQHITYDVLNEIMNDFQVQILPFAQLIVKFPVMIKLQETFSRTFTALESVGMRPFHASVVNKANTSEEIEYSFFNLRGKHLLLVGSE